MASQTKTALLADIAAKIVAGAPGSITEAEVRQLMQDIVDSSIGTVLDAEITMQGKQDAHALTIVGRGASPSGSTGAGPVALRIASNVDQETDAIRVYRSAAGLAANQAAGWINSRMGIYSNAELIISGNHAGSGLNNLLMASIMGDVPVSLELGTAQVERGSAISLVSRMGGQLIEEVDVHGIGEWHHKIVDRGPVLRSTDGTHWLLTVSDAGALVVTRIASMDVGTDAQAAPAWLTTLITNLGGNAAWPAVYYAGAKVVAADGYVTTLKDTRGAGFGPDATGPADVKARPYWDGASAVKALVTRHAQTLSTPNAAALALSAINSVVVVGAVEPAYNTYVAGIDNTDGHWWRIQVNGGVIVAEGLGTNGFVRPSSGVAASRTVRTIAMTRNGVNSFIDIPNQPRVQGPLPLFSAAQGRARLFGMDGTYCVGRFPLVMFGTNFLSEADVDTIRDAAVANLGAVNA